MRTTTNMENIGPPLQDPQVRFMLDNLIDGVKDQSVLLWQALDTHTHEVVWVIGRQIKEGSVLPLALLQPSSQATVERYAPAKPGGGWDYRMIQNNSPIIKP